MKSLVQFQLIDEKRSVTYLILFQVWLMVAVYAVLHDQYIVRIAPEHFTIYHEPLLGIENPERLAAVYAFAASFSPGLLLGFACALVARTGSWPRLSRPFILKGVVVIILATEIIAASSGYFVSKRGSGIYPDSWYPNQTLPLLITQTIQVTCYFSAAVFSGILLCVIMVTRFKKSR